MARRIRTETAPAGAADRTHEWDAIRLALVTTSDHPAVIRQFEDARVAVSRVGCDRLSVTESDLAAAWDAIERAGLRRAVESIVGSLRAARERRGA